MELNARLMEKDRKITEDLKAMRAIQGFTITMNELYKTIDTHLLDGLQKEMKSVEAIRRLEHETSMAKSRRPKLRDGPVEPNKAADDE